MQGYIVSKYALELGISNVTARSEVYSMVESEAKDEVATIAREFKLRKTIILSFLES